MVLKLNSIKPQDRGVYRCTAMNKVDTVIHDVKLDVKFQPVITVARPTVMQAIGYRAELQCTAEANPFPKADTTDVAWVKGTTTYSVTSDSYNVRFIQGAFSRLSYELIITSVRPEDYGTFTCRVKNNFGTSNGQVVLKQTNVPQPSVKLGRVVPGNERPDSAPSAPRGIFLFSVISVLIALLLSYH
jgi:neurotrimin